MTYVFRYFNLNLYAYLTRNLIMTKNKNFDKNYHSTIKEIRKNYKPERTDPYQDPMFDEYGDPLFDEDGSPLFDNSDPDDDHIRLKAKPSNFPPEFLQAIKAYGEGKPINSKYKGIFDTMDVNKKIPKLLKSKINLKNLK